VCVCVCCYSVSEYIIKYVYMIYTFACILLCINYYYFRRIVRSPSESYYIPQLVSQSRIGIRLV